MATSSREKRTIDHTGVGMYKSAKTSFLEPVQEEYDEKMDIVVLDLVRKHDLLPKDVSTPEEVAEWLNGLSDIRRDLELDVEVPEKPEFEEDLVTTVAVERTTKDALNRKVEELGFGDLNYAEDRYTNTLRELVRVHEILPQPTAILFQDWKRIKNVNPKENRIPNTHSPVYEDNSDS